MKNMMLKSELKNLIREAIKELATTTPGLLKEHYLGELPSKRLPKFNLAATKAAILDEYEEGQVFEDENDEMDKPHIDYENEINRVAADIQHCIGTENTVGTIKSIIWGLAMSDQDDAVLKLFKRIRIYSKKML